MLITDHFFLLYFFPIFLAIYYAVNQIQRKTLTNIVVVVASFLFYFSFGPQYWWALIAPLVLDYGMTMLLTKSENKRLRMIGLIASLCVNIGLLAYFKYYNFFLDSAGSLMQQFLHVDKLVLKGTLPVGISFLTFQRISYVVDVYKKKATAEKNILRYLVYACLFPHILAGPIIRFADVSKQLTERHITKLNIFYGFAYLSIGLVAKSFIADQLLVIEDLLVQSMSELNFLLGGFLIFIFTLRLYFDFMGYSLIAIGLARFIGFHLPENFDSPYRSISIQDFWRRWNITLTNWLRDYVYIPLGGNRNGKWKTNMNLIITMLVAGLWHGASWSFVIWGGYHGILLTIERINPYKISNKLLRQIMTFFLVVVGWIPFRFSEWTQVKQFVQVLIVTHVTIPSQVIQKTFFLILPSLFLAILWVIFLSETKIKSLKYGNMKLLLFFLMYLFGLGYSLINPASQFIYFQF